MLDNKSIAAAHVFYDDYLSVNDSDHPFLCSETKWRHELLSATPNGHLLKQNTFFDALNNQTIWLAHITSSLDKALEFGALSPSGGCLVGSIYCIQAYALSDSIFSMHNLGNWIYFEEAPMAIDKDALSSLEVVLIRIDRPATLHSRPIGIDYTRLGQFHFDIYADLKYLLTRQERHELEGLTVDKLKGSIGFLSEVERLAQRERIDANDSKAFIDKYAHFVPTLPILGYLYFETLLDYILYYQDDATATEYANKGEFYNYYYKRIAKDINETLYKKFQLSSFAASADKLTAILRKYTDKGLIFKSFNEEHFVRFLAERLVYRVHNYLKIGHTMRDRSLINWSFEGLAEDFSPLLGHLIHRELRSFNRFPDFYYYFDQTKALKVWNYWNNHDIVIPFNGIVPKGEVGINPAYIDNTKYAIYQTKVTDHSGKLEITNKLDMRISSRLIDLKYTLMRNRK